MNMRLGSQRPSACYGLFDAVICICAAAAGRHICSRRGQPETKHVYIRWVGSALICAGSKDQMYYLDTNRALPRRNLPLQSKFGNLYAT